MRVPWCLLILVSCAYATPDESRAKKQPIVVDAVGNTLPPPSNVPAIVGSPVNLITPDRYEFYTFDESGELVKRLMTLEEIQAIVAAGEEAEGLVTLANDKQPTPTFNFSQPPYTVLHSVVTNVQNVLKEQMEAHKKDPMFQPTLDTPDVSDSWSLILPSIFGNTGLDIVPDKISSGVTTPETEMMEFEQSKPGEEEDSDYSKEGSNDVIGSSTISENTGNVHITSKTPLIKDEEISSETTSSTYITTTTPKATTTKTRKPTTTTTRKPSSSTTRKTTTTTTRKTVLSTTTTPRATTKKYATTRTPTTTTKVPTTSRSPSTTRESIPSIPYTSTKAPIKTTTIKEVLSTTRRVIAQSTSTTSKPRTSTSSRPQVNTSSTKSRQNVTTIRPTITTKAVRITPIVTTSRPISTKTQPWSTVGDINLNKANTSNKNSIQTEKYEIQYEKISTYIPISTASTINLQQTPKPYSTFTSRPISHESSSIKESITTSPEDNPPITTYKPATSTTAYTSSTVQTEDLEKMNTTTITTQSVSPSTTVSSTEFLSADTSNFNSDPKPTDEISNVDTNAPMIPLFDLAQSISQISSDLGSNYMPIPTVNNLLDSSKLDDMNLESKENIEIDIPTENEFDAKKPNISDNSNDHFVKISTLDPHSNDLDNTTENDSTEKNIAQSTTTRDELIIIPESTTIDRILSESMGDLISQVVNQTPQSISVDVSDSSKPKINEDYVSTTEITNDFSTTENALELTTITIDIPSEKSNVSKNIVDKEQIGNEIPTLETTTPSNVSTLRNDSIRGENISSTNLVLLEQSTEPYNNKDYVEISVTHKNKVSQEKPFLDNNKPILNTVPSNKVNSSNKYEESIQTDEYKERISTAGNLHISTTMKPTQIANINQTSNMKIAISEKVPEFKIDEFKKKIQKVNIDDTELANERNNSWKLISTVTPPKANEIQKDKHKPSSSDHGNKEILLGFSNENQGLEVTTKDLDEDISKFTELCNELAFRYWNALVENIDKRRSFVLSPYSITSMLAMMFMGARGATSGEMNDILKLDDMVTFNPHFTLKNISDSIETTPGSGVIISAFIRELYSDRSKGKILTFYKERAQQFYNGHVEEVNFKLISDIIRRRSNLLVKRYTWGKILEYMKSNSIMMNPPLAAFSANIFETDCTGSSVEGRDGEMYFVVSPNVRQRRLVPVPAVVYRGGFLAGYDPVLDATAAALGSTTSIISTLFIMPGQQGNVVHAEDLEALEQRLLEANPSTPAWNRLLRTLLPRPGLELQIPRFSHKSIFNISSTLKNMGLKDLFDAENADLGGLIGPSKDLYLSDMIQSTTFVTCGEGVVGEQHHVEEYPESLGTTPRRFRRATDWAEPRDYQRAFHDPHDVGEAMHLPLHLRPRQARLPARNAQPARLKFDRPFLYFVRHNPTGMILYVGRYNPRLLP